MSIYSPSEPGFYEAITTAGMEWANLGGRELGWNVGAVAMRDDETDDSAPVVMIAELPPGSGVPRHTHNAHRVEILLKGSLSADGRILQPGDVQVSGPGEFYGPNTAGPEGATTIEIISSVSGVFRILPEDGASDEDVAQLGRMWELIQSHRKPSQSSPH